MSISGSSTREKQGGGGGGDDLKDASLEKNPQFKEMLIALEFHDNSLHLGETASKYDLEFFNGLRTMMRECLFTKEDSLRKQHVQRVYDWFVEKKMRSSAAQRMEPRSKAKGSPVGASSPSNMIAKKTLVPRSQESLKQHLERQQRKPMPHTFTYRKDTGSAISDADRKINYLNSSSTPARSEPRTDKEEPPPPAATPLTTGNTPVPRHHARQSALPAPMFIPTTPASFGSPREMDISKYKTRNLALSQMRRTGKVPPKEPEPESSPEPAKAVPEDKERPFVHYKIQHPTEVIMHERWLQKRAEQEMEKKGQKEVVDAMEWWSTHRARIEEEISRRQEANRFSSQTGSIYGGSRPSTALSQRGAVLQRSREEAEWSDSSGDDDADIEVFEDLVQTGPTEIPETFTQRTPSRPRSGRSRPASARPPSAILRRPDPDATNVGLSPYHTVYVDQHVRAGGLGSSSGLPPDDLNASTASADATLGSVKRVLYGFTSPHADEPTEAEATGFPRRPLSAAYSVGSRATSARSSRPMSAPASRINQLGEVERIKRSFAHQSIVCPLDVIERGMLIPEDKAYGACLLSLPTPGAHLRISNPFAKSGKKGKKGKKGGKKGKKGGKKKGKKGGKKKKK